MSRVRPNPRQVAHTERTPGGPFILYADHDSSPVGGYITWEAALGPQGDRWGIWIEGEKRYPRPQGKGGDGHGARAHPYAGTPVIPVDAVEGRDLVFAPQVVMLNGTVNTGDRKNDKAPSLTAIEGSPGLYRLCGRATHRRINGGDGWLVDCGAFTGFSLDALPTTAATGGVVIADVQLRAHGGWFYVPGPAEMLPRSEPHLPYSRWRVVEFGWPELDPVHPEQKALIRASLHGAGPWQPAMRLVCRRLAAAEAPASNNLHK